MPAPKQRRRVKGFAPRGLGEEMDSDPARGFAPYPGDAGGGGAIHQSSVDATDVDREGGRDVLEQAKRPLLYHWIDLPQIPKMFLEHLWISEDQRFFQHEGFDWKEMDLAVKEAERKGKPVRGASTITNQCARSIFLWQGRSWIRKGLESYYTIWMEALLPKRRILELYANVIEMGRGIYGVEAASQHYFGVSARGLTREQSAMLAAVLPNPKGWDPTKPGGTLRWRQRRILQRERNANFPERLLR